MWYSFKKCLPDSYTCCGHTNPDIFHLYAANTSYTFSHGRSVYVRVSVWVLTRTDKLRYLDERQRLLSAADQRSFLLLLLLNDGGKGHQGGGEGRAAHCTQHPGPEGERRVMQRERGEVSVPALGKQHESKCVDKGWVNYYWQAPVWTAACPPGFHKSPIRLQNSTEVKVFITQYWDGSQSSNTWHLWIYTYNSVLTAADELQMEEACR